MRGAEMKIISKLAGYVFCFILITFLLNLIPPALSAAEIKTPPKVVMGTIEEVGSYTIKVKGKEYDISNVRILTGRGIRVTKDNLIQGIEVEIWFDGNEATSVIVKNKQHNIKE
jgi:hypothetical protein